MIAGLPPATWVLMALAVVPGVVLAVVARRVHRGGDGGRTGEPDQDGGGGPQAPQARSRPDGGHG